MRILVVDDSRAMRAYVRGVLKANYDCSLKEVTSGFEALRLLPRERFDLVITDVNMPDINGLELIRFIRSSDRYRDVPVLIISTQTTDQAQEKVFELGANGFLAKPFEPKMLVEAVAKVTGREGECGSADEP